MEFQIPIISIDKKAQEVLDRMTSKNELGHMHFTSDPSGKSVYIDGEYMGTTPLTLIGIRPGKHQAEIRND
jgi:diacylglycerol kinase family enzyme